MKTIKIKYVGYWDGYQYQRTVLYNVLTKFYNVELSDDPDYIICGIFGSLYDYCKYSQVRILDCGENYLPDFNLVDYAICRYPLSLQDRCLYVPGCISCEMPTAERFKALSNKSRNYTKEILNEKKYFANFICRHESENGIRGDFFKELCKYKKVLSVGPYLNNTGNAINVTWEDGSKPEFQRQCKFSLCFESTKHQGFVTEKISDAFYSDTIPIYFGSDDVTSIFNENAFIQCKGREDFDKTIRKIIELDSDDEKYLEMLRQPILINNNYFDEKMEEYERFVKNIFDQQLEKAYRRSRVYWPKTYDDYLSFIKTDEVYMHATLLKLFKAFWIKIYRKIFRMQKKKK